MTRPGSPTSPPPVQSREFEGPLDLLLEEVRRQNVEIDKIAMAPIVSGFLEYMGTAAERNLKLDMDWLHMAATLIHWKSQSLLPCEPGGRSERDAIRDSLIQQLVAHRGQLGQELGRRRSIEQGRISRCGSSVVGVESSESQDAAFFCVWDLIQEARELAGWVEKHREEVRQWQDLEVEPDEVTVLTMIEYLRTQLPVGECRKLDGAQLLLEEQSPSRKACLFLGMLEMVRGQELELHQKEAFGPLWLWRP